VPELVVSPETFDVSPENGVSRRVRVPIVSGVIKIFSLVLGATRLTNGVWIVALPAATLTVNPTVVGDPTVTVTFVCTFVSTNGLVSRSVTSDSLTFLEGNETCAGKLAASGPKTLVSTRFRVPTAVPVTVNDWEFEFVKTRKLLLKVADPDVADI
jgi:hypothetical protein